MKFNTSAQADSKTENLAGGEAFTETPKLKLATMVLTSFLKDQHYRSQDAALVKLKQLLTQVPPDYAAKTAIYARQQFGMRSISHLIAGEIAHNVHGEAWTKYFYEAVIHRPDDITEIIAYYMSQYGKVPNALKKGLARAFDKFDGYQLAKYRSSTKKIKLIDAVNLVHPKPMGKNMDALKQLAKNQLTSVDTWESELTRAGQNAESTEEKATLKKDVWVKLVNEKKIGYFALLRNLRNIMDQAPECLPNALAMLTDEALIKKSLVLPFRYQTALKALEQNGATPREVTVAISKAVDISLNNVPCLAGKTLVALDCSGSMIGQPLEIGSLFAAVLYKANDSDLILFSNDAEYFNPNPLDTTLSLARQIYGRAEGGGTNFHAIFQRASKAYSRIIILSDMQAWLGYDTPKASFTEYKQRNNANSHIYSFDLQGYGTLQFPENNVYALAGFSEKVFDLMPMLEEDKHALVKKIEAIQIKP
jgi:60 kDa SS-A/Ro ribonucleoprotein